MKPFNRTMTSYIKVLFRRFFKFWLNFPNRKRILSTLNRISFHLILTSRTTSEEEYALYPRKFVQNINEGVYLLEIPLTSIRVDRFASCEDIVPRFQLTRHSKLYSKPSFKNMHIHSMFLIWKHFGVFFSSPFRLMKLLIMSWSFTFKLSKMDSRYNIESVKYPDYRQMQGGGLKEGDLNEGYSFSSNWLK